MQLRVLNVTALRNNLQQTAVLGITFLLEHCAAASCHRALRAQAAKECADFWLSPPCPEAGRPVAGVGALFQENVARHQAPFPHCGFSAPS